MSMSKKFVWRLGLWSALMLYIFLDVLLFKGPVHKMREKLREDGPSLQADTERGVVSRVFNRPIYLSQVDFAVDQALWSTGKDRTGIHNERRRFLRAVALRDIQDQYILREKVRLNADDHPVSDEEIDAAVKRFSTRFNSTQEMTEALKRYKFQGEKELRYRLAAKLQQDKYILSKIQPGLAVNDEEAEKWYKDYKEEAATPERVKVQHIFISRLPAPRQTSEAKATYAKEKLEYCLQSLLTDGDATWAGLAADFSEDERSKRHEGHLDWIRKDRIAADFTEACFSAELNTPHIIETKLGWHLVNILEKKAATIRSYEEMKPEIVMAIETIRRKDQIETYRLNLRKQHGDVIKTNWQIMESDWTN